MLSLSLFFNIHVYLLSLLLTIITDPYQEFDISEFCSYCSQADRWNISVLRRDLKVVRDGDVRMPCDMQFQADVAEAANARLPRMAWLTLGMARSVVDDDRIAAVVDWLLRVDQMSGLS